MRRPRPLFLLLALVALASVGVSAIQLATSSARRGIGAQFERVEIGMTEQEVCAILGKPSPGGTKVSTGGDIGLCWVTDVERIDIIFDRSGTVQFRRCQETEPPGLIWRLFEWLGLL